MLETLHPFLQDTWKKSNYTEPTPIQRKAVPIILEGKDVLLESPTGTGKTVSYLLPLLQQIDPESKNVQVVILAPSRELAMQIYQEFQKWSENSSVSGTALIGDVNIKRQLEKLKEKPQVIIGTTGRIIELIQLKKLKMHEVKTIVVDEADQLTSDGHVKELHQIVKSTLKERQVLFVSATISEKTEQVAKEFMQQSEIIRISRDELKPSLVEHIYFVCEQRDKIDMLRRLMRMEELKALTFLNDIEKISSISAKLEFNGLPLALLNADTKKVEREKALKDFRASKVPLLLATDVAARGLDIEDLSHVIHFDLAKDSAQYVHRSGRTGRMGRAGTVISFVTDREERVLLKYGRDLGLTMVKKGLYKGQIVDVKPTVKRNTSKSKPKNKNK